MNGKNLSLVLVVVLYWTSMARAQLPDADKVEAIFRKCINARRAILAKKTTTVDSDIETKKLITELQNSIKSSSFKTHCMVIDILNQKPVNAGFKELTLSVQILEVPTANPESIKLQFKNSQAATIKPNTMLEFEGIVETANKGGLDVLFLLPLNEGDSQFLSEKENYGFYKSMTGNPQAELTMGFYSSRYARIDLTFITKKWTVLSFSQAKKIEPTIKPMDSRWYIQKYANNQKSTTPSTAKQTDIEETITESLCSAFQVKLERFIDLAQRFEERIKVAGNSALEQEERNAYLNELRNLFGKREKWSFGASIIDVSAVGGNYVARVSTTAPLDLFGGACDKLKHIPRPNAESQLTIDVSREEAKQFSRNSKVLLEGTVFHESTTANVSRAIAESKSKLLIRFDSSSALFITDLTILPGQSKENSGNNEAAKSDDKK